MARLLFHISLRGETSEIGFSSSSFLHSKRWTTPKRYSSGSCFLCHQSGRRDKSVSLGKADWKHTPLTSEWSCLAGDDSYKLESCVAAWIGTVAQGPCINCQAPSWFSKLPGTVGGTGGRQFCHARPAHDRTQPVHGKEPGFISTLTKSGQRVGFPPPQSKAKLTAHSPEMYTEGHSAP